MSRSLIASFPSTSDIPRLPETAAADLRFRLRPDAEVLFADTVGLCLFRLLFAGFHAMRLLQDRLQVAFAMLAAAPQGFDVIQVPGVAGQDLPAGKLTNASELFEDAKADARRDRCVMSLSNPFLNGPHRLLHHLAIAGTLAPEPDMVVRGGQAGMKHAVALWAFHPRRPNALFDHLRFHLHAVGDRRQDRFFVE
ncbi:hypothetical protein [Rhizobium leguminosarum]